MQTFTPEPLIRTSLMLALFLAGTVAIAQNAGEEDRASKKAVARGNIDGVSVAIDYSRPKAKGRTIWGALVPYGEVWRAGANEATTISLSRDTWLEGNAVPAGTYSLFLIPRSHSWTFVINKVAEQWGAFRYDSAFDLVRFDVVPESCEPVEEMIFRVDGNRVSLAWGSLEGSFTVGQ